MILLYADDPGAANYLAPIARALEGKRPAQFIVDSALRSFIMDRGIACSIRQETAPDRLLHGADLLVVGTSENPDCFGHQLTIVARQSGCTSLGVIDMQVNAARRFKGRSAAPLAFAPDYLAVPDQGSSDAFTALGFPTERVFLCGHPLYDDVRERRRQFERTPPARAAVFPEARAGAPIWLFIGEGVDQLDPPVSFRSSGYTLHGRGDTDFRGAIVLEEIVAAAASQPVRPWIVLRLHPKNQLEEFAPCLSGVDAVSSEGDPLPLLWTADLVFGMTSMLLLEAALLGRPHLSVLPRGEEREWLATLPSGVTPTVTTAAELTAQLAAGVTPPDVERLRAVLPERCTERAVAAIQAVSPAF